MKYIVLVMIACISVFSIQLFADTSASEESILNKLKTTKIDVEYKETLIDDVFKDVAKKTGITIIFKAKDGDYHIDLEGYEITLKMENVSAYDVLQKIAYEIDVKLSFKAGALYIVTPEQYYEGRNITKIYDVRDLENEIRNFEPPNIRLKGDEPAPAVELELSDCSDCIFDPKGIEDFITIFVEPDSWDDNYGATICYFSGYVVIRQVPEIHAEIQKFLNELRQCR